MPPKHPRQDQKKVRKGRKIKGSAKPKRRYSGKKKRFVNKTQLVVNAQTQQVLCVDFALGSTHDFNLYKQSKLGIHPQIKLKTDSGYLAVKRLHANWELPQKNTKLKKLTKEQKKHNRQLARERIGNEHVIGKLKIFKLLEHPYRNHSPFGLRFTLIAGLYNAHLNAA